MAEVRTSECIANGRTRPAPWSEQRKTGTEPRPWYRVNTEFTAAAAATANRSNARFSVRFLCHIRVTPNSIFALMSDIMIAVHDGYYTSFFRTLYANGTFFAPWRSSCPSAYHPPWHWTCAADRSALPLTTVNVIGVGRLPRFLRRPTADVSGKVVALGRGEKYSTMVIFDAHCPNIIFSDFKNIYFRRKLEINFSEC